MNLILFSKSFNKSIKSSILEDSILLIKSTFNKFKVFKAFWVFTSGPSLRFSRPTPYSALAKALLTSFFKSELLDKFPIKSFSLEISKTESMIFSEIFK